MSGHSRLRWYDHLIGLLLAAAYVTLLVATAHDLGYARDEGFYFHAARAYAGWFEQLLQNPHEALLRASIDRAWGVNHEHPPLVKSTFAISWMLLFKKLHWFAQEGTSFRLPGMLSAGIIVWLLYVWGMRVRSRATGVTAALGFALMPRVFYHAHLDCFDIPIVAAWLACAYAYWRSLVGGGWRWALATAVLFGLALATKHNSWFLPITFCVHTLLTKAGAWRRQGRTGVMQVPIALPLMATLGPLIFYALWPWIWHDTVSRLQAYVNFHTGHEYYNMEFLGTTYWKPPMPHGYAWLMTVSTVPLVTLALALCGLATTTRAWWTGRADRPTRSACLLWVLAILINYAPWLSSSTPIFGGTKHWMTAYPFLALLAGVGFDWILQQARQSGPDWLQRPAVAPSLVGLACIASPLTQTLHSHPFGLSNYTPLVGGASGAATLGLNRGFWGFTTGSVTHWLNTHAGFGSGVFLHDTAGDAWNMLVRDGKMRRDLRPTWSPADGNFALYHHEPHMAGVEYQVWVAYGTTAPAYIPLYDGVPVVWVYARPGSIR